MNQSDMETINKLKELRDKNALTQEEFDEQVAIYLNSNKNEKITESNGDKFRFSWIIYVILAIVSIVSYIVYLVRTPNCGTNDVKKTLDGVLKEDLLSNHSFSLSAFSEILSDKTNDTRKCKANIIINGQPEDIIYTVKNTDLFHFSVALDDTSSDYLNYKYKLLCDDKEQIIPTLFEHIAENLNIQPISLEDSKELSYDDSNYKRQCTAVLKFNNDKKEAIEYDISKLDEQHFSVTLTDACYATIFSKYKLLCNDNERVIPTLFEIIEESFGVKPKSIGKYKELSYNENTHEKQCATVINFENNNKSIVKYSVSYADDAGSYSVSLDNAYLNKSMTQQCNIFSEKYAQNVISSNYAEFSNLQLDNVEFVSKNEQENYVICRSNTNINSFSAMHYKLSKENDEIYVSLKSPFECNKASMMIAQALIVSNYDGLKNIKLHNPQKIKEDGDVLTCKVDTNSKELNTISYRLQKADGQNYANIDIDIFSDVVDNVVDQMIEQLENYDEWEIDE